MLDSTFAKVRHWLYLAQLISTLLSPGSVGDGAEDGLQLSGVLLASCVTSVLA